MVGPGGGKVEFIAGINGCSREKEEEDNSPPAFTSEKNMLQSKRK